MIEDEMIDMMIDIRIIETKGQSSLVEYLDDDMPCRAYVPPEAIARQRVPWSSRRVFPSGGTRSSPQPESSRTARQAWSIAQSR